MTPMPPTAPNPEEAPTLDFLAPTLDSPARSTSQASESSVPDLLATPANLPATAAYRRPVLPAPGPGALFGTYELLEKLGQGGMGIVYRARDLKLGRELALKVIRDGGFAEARQVERFYQEARAAARLDHPNILPIYEIDQHAGQHFFTMKLIAGGSLLKSFPAYVGDARKAAELMEKVARAVHEAHANGILHRDLKPGNILLDEGEPLVADFGLAKILGTNAMLTETGLPVGTPAYMAPEQAAGESEGLTPASDVWSLGVILYELLTGVRPFAGMSSDEILRQIKSSDPTPPRFFKPKLDRDLETICLKCLEKEPSRRYATAQELAEELGRWRRGEPIRATRGWHYRTIRFARRHLRLLAFVGVVAITALTVAIVHHVTDPVRHVEAQLARGETAILVSEKVPPKYSRRAFGQVIVTPPASNRVTSVHSRKLGLLELHPRTSQRAFQMTVELHQPRWSDEGEMGLYFAYQATHEGHSYWVLSCKETRSAADPTQYQARIRLRLERQIAETNEALDAGPERIFPTKSRTRYRLQLIVADDRVEVFMDGLPLWKLGRQQIDQLTKRFESNAMVVPRPCPFAPQGGIGLYVRMCEGAFHNVAIQPIGSIVD